MRKYTGRLIVGFFIYCYYRITSIISGHELYEFNTTSLLYLIYTLISVMLVWEIAARSIRFYKKGICKMQGNPSFIIRKVATRVGLITLPVVILATYLHSFYISPWLDYPVRIPSQDYFIHMLTQSIVLTLLIIAYEVIMVYKDLSVRDARERVLIEKELHVARYESLKNQLNPHFLFNSFSVLTSLISEDAKLAEAFVASLSRMYRYILDHKDDKLVSLKEEMRFLNQYLFLLKIRHEEGIRITNSISLHEEDILLPSLSLQMLVENAVKHNQFSKADPLEIVLSNEGEDFLVVRNKLKKPKTPVDSTGTGLSNLSKRYQLSFDADIEVSQDAEHYQVKLPIQRRSA